MLRTSCLDIPKAECIFYTFYFRALMNRVQELGENSGFPQALLSRIRLLELIFFKFSVYRCMIFPGSRLQQYQKQQTKIRNVLNNDKDTSKFMTGEARVLQLLSTSCL